MTSAITQIGGLSDYSVEIRVKNARILGLMRRAGIATASELARRSNTSPNEISLYINLRRSPLASHTGQYLTAVVRIAEALYCHPDDMFTERQKHTFMERNRRCIEMSEAEVEQQLAALERASPDEHLLQIEHEDVVKSAMMKRLSENQRLVLGYRYGLGGSELLTYDEIASRLGLSDARVQQIERNALRRLHPSLLPLARQVLPQTEHRSYAASQ